MLKSHIAIITTLSFIASCSPDAGITTPHYAVSYGATKVRLTNDTYLVGRVEGDLPAFAALLDKGYGGSRMSEAKSKRTEAMRAIELHSGCSVIEDAISFDEGIWVAFVDC